MTTESSGVSDDEVAELYRTSTELEASEDANGHSTTAPIALSSDLPGASLLNGLTNAAPFSEFLHFKAHANCVGKTDQDRIRQYTAEHPTLAKFCMISDLIFRVFVVVATLAAVAAVITGIILKTVYT
ncbi:MAG: hypothetical protein H6523_11315 [Mycolicibacterium sp.]|nr:hypothetical protein [Mycolicibacterium sp.]